MVPGPLSAMGGTVEAVGSSFRPENEHQNLSPSVDSSRSRSMRSPDVYEPVETAGPVVTAILHPFAQGIKRRFRSFKSYD